MKPTNANDYKFYVDIEISVSSRSSWAEARIHCTLARLLKLCAEQIAKHQPQVW